MYIVTDEKKNEPGVVVEGKSDRSMFTSRDRSISVNTWVEVPFC